MNDNRATITAATERALREQQAAREAREETARQEQAARDRQNAKVGAEYRAGLPAKRAPSCSAI